MQVHSTFTADNVLLFKLVLQSLRVILEKKLNYSNSVKFIIVCYLVIALVCGFFSMGPRQVFTGTWFKKTPIEISDYGIYVLADPAGIIKGSAYIEWIPELTSKTWFFQLYGLIQQIGTASEMGTARDLDRTITIFRSLVPTKNLKFEIHKRTLNTIEYLKTRKVITYDVLPNTK